MKRGLVAAGAVALLLLTGCTSTVTSETVTVTPGASGTFSDGDTTVEVQPLAADAPVSEFAKDFVASVDRNASVQISEKESQRQIDEICSEASSGQTADTASTLSYVSDGVIRALLFEGVVKNYCSSAGSTQ